MLQSSRMYNFRRILYTKPISNDSKLRRGLSSNLHHSDTNAKVRTDRTRPEENKYYLLLLKIPKASRLFYAEADSIFSITSSRVFLFQPFMVATKFTNPTTCAFVYSCIYTTNVYIFSTKDSAAESIGLVYARERRKKKYEKIRLFTG